MPTLDPRLLGIFMLLSTQTNWVHDLLPADGSKPADFKKTKLYDVGLKEDIQQDFYVAFSSTAVPGGVLKTVLANLAAAKTKRDAHRLLFEALSVALSEAPVSYSPPPCPKKNTLQYIIDAVNTAPVQ